MIKIGDKSFRSCLYKDGIVNFNRLKEYRKKDVLYSVWKNFNI